MTEPTPLMAQRPVGMNKRESSLWLKALADAALAGKLPAEAAQAARDAVMIDRGRKLVRKFARKNGYAYN